MEPLDYNFEKNQIYLLSIASQSYRNFEKMINNCLARKFKNILFITVNEPFSSILNDSVIPKGLNIHVIDCISAKAGVPKSQENVTFVSSPNALTEISIAVKRQINKKIDFVVFSSLSTMLIYEKPQIILRFFHSLLTSIRNNNTGGLVLTNKNETSKVFIDDIMMFFDKQLEIE